MYSGHVFTSIDIDTEGGLYACDDATGALCAIDPETSGVRTLLAGNSYHFVHVSGDVISLCNEGSDEMTLCDKSDNVSSKFSEVIPTAGFSSYVLIVWASALYLVVLALALALRKLVTNIRNGNAKNIGPMLLSVFVVTAVATAIGSLSHASYQKMIELRTNEINMCADYLANASTNLGDIAVNMDDRDALHKAGKEQEAMHSSLFDLAFPALTLTYAANKKTTSACTSTCMGKMPGANSTCLAALTNTSWELLRANRKTAS